METLYRKFVKEWMEEHEIDTFIKDESGRVMYTSGGTTINLVHYFEELLEDFDEKLQADKEELLEALEKATDLLEAGFPEISAVKDFQSLIQKQKQ